MMRTEAGDCLIAAQILGLGDVLQPAIAIAAEHVHP